MLSLVGFIAVVGFLFSVPGRLLLAGVLWVISTGLPFLLLVLLLKK